MPVRIRSRNRNNSNSLISKTVKNISNVSANTSAQFNGFNSSSIISCLNNIPKTQDVRFLERKTNLLKNIR